VSAAFAKLDRTNLVLARPPEKLGMLGKCLADCRCCRCCSLRFRLVHGVASRFVPVVELGYEQAMRVQSSARGPAREGNRTRAMGSATLSSKRGQE